MFVARILKPEREATHGLLEQLLLDRGRDEPHRAEFEWLVHKRLSETVDIISDVSILELWSLSFITCYTVRSRNEFRSVHYITWLSLIPFSLSTKSADVIFQLRLQFTTWTSVTFYVNPSGKINYCDLIYCDCDFSNENIKHHSKNPFKNRTVSHSYGEIKIFNQCLIMENSRGISMICQHVKQWTNLNMKT